MGFNKLHLLIVSFNNNNNNTNSKDKLQQTSCGYSLLLRHLWYLNYTIQKRDENNKFTNAT